MKDDKKQSILDLHVLSRALAEWRIDVYDKPVIREWVDRKHKEIVNEIAERISVEWKEKK